MLWPSVLALAVSHPLFQVTTHGDPYPSRSSTVRASTTEWNQVSSRGFKRQLGPSDQEMLESLVQTGTSSTHPNPVSIFSPPFGKLPRAKLPTIQKDVVPAKRARVVGDRRDTVLMKGPLSLLRSWIQNGWFPIRRRSTSLQPQPLSPQRNPCCWRVLGAPAALAVWDALSNASPLHPP